MTKYLYDCTKEELIGRVVYMYPQSPAIIREVTRWEKIHHKGAWGGDDYTTTEIEVKIEYLKPTKKHGKIRDGLSIYYLKDFEALVEETERKAHNHRRKLDMLKDMA